MLPLGPEIGPVSLVTASKSFGYTLYGYLRVYEEL